MRACDLWGRGCWHWRCVCRCTAALPPLQCPAPPCLMPAVCLCLPTCLPACPLRSHRLEICTFLLPHYFLPIGALANAIKGLSWMAGGSTKSVFKARHPCRRQRLSAAAQCSSTVRVLFSSGQLLAPGVCRRAQCLPAAPSRAGIIRRRQQLWGCERQGHQPDPLCLHRGHLGRWVGLYQVVVVGVNALPLAGVAKLTLSGLPAVPAVPAVPAGVLLASQIGQSVGTALCCYVALAGLHLYTGYRAVSWGSSGTCYSAAAVTCAGQQQ